MVCIASRTPNELNQLGFTWCTDPIDIFHILVGRVFRSDSRILAVSPYNETGLRSKMSNFEISLLGVKSGLGVGVGWLWNGFGAV